MLVCLRDFVFSIVSLCLRMCSRACIGVHVSASVCIHHSVGVVVHAHYLVRILCHEYVCVCVSPARMSEFV